MDIAERINDVERRFDEQQDTRQEHLRAAEECLVEMNKLQGEWRLLNDLKIEPNKKATTIEAVPEKASK